MSWEIVGSRLLKEAIVMLFGKGGNARVERGRTAQQESHSEGISALTLAPHIGAAAVKTGDELLLI
jgi:hypothetical protein